MTVQRRTQAERSDAMRKRILDATIQCLAMDGYAGTTISRIIETAKVSRGAPIHHFPTKNAMIIAAAEQLVQKVFLQVQDAMSELNTSANRIHDLVYLLWDSVFTKPEFIAMSELLLNCRRDPELTAVMQPFLSTTHAILGDITGNYFEPLDAQNNVVGEMWMMTRWMLRGLAMDYSIIQDRSVFDHYLKIWCQVLAMHMRAKEEVDTSLSIPFQTS